jgi:hypothetical protein
MGQEGEMPIDQRPDDGRSQLFTTEPLREQLEILGAPELTLAFDADRPVAQIIVRLNDIFPDGSSGRVTYGVLNLTHRESHAEPSALEPGRRYQAVVRLNDTAHAFATGNRIGLAISTAYWPMVWPAPEAVALGVYAGTSRLTLPVRPARDEDSALLPFEAPETGPGQDPKVLRNSTLRRSIERDLPTGDVVYRVFNDGGEFDGAALVRLEDIDLEAGFAVLQRYQIGEADPTSAKAEIVAHALLRRGDWAPELRGRVEMNATAAYFRIRATITVNEGLSEVFQRQWDETIPRDLV